MILAYGLVILFSASYSLSYQETGDSLSQIRQQVIFAAVGVAAMFFDRHRWITARCAT